LPGNATRLDYQSLDPQRHLLFIAHLGDGQVVVYNVALRRVVSVISGVARVHGVLAIPELSRVYASATGTNEIAVIDERRLALIARVPAGVYPDGIAYDPRTRRIFVSDEHGKTVTIIDTATDARVATIPLGGDVGNSQYDASSGHIFSADQTHNELVEIDPAKAVVLRRFSLPGCQGSHGLYVDASERLAYIACEDNARLVTFDFNLKKVIQQFSVGDSPDTLAFDIAERRLYVASESGYVSIFKEKSRRLQATLTVFVAPAAHTVAVDQHTHLLYLPLESIHERPVLRILEFR
jgi:YVTN family beta-propeller protein